MANIFQMFGEIMVDNAKANAGIDETTNKGKDLGTKLSEATDKIGKGFAAVGTAAGAMVTAIGGAVVAGAKKLSDMTVGAASYADEILTASKVTGMSTESLQSYKYAAELVDTSLETMTGSMAKQIRSMNAVKGAAGDAAVDTEKLSKAQTSAANAALDVEAAQQKYNAAVAKSGKDSDTAQQAALALEKAQNKLAQAQSDVTTASKPVAEKSNDMAKAYQTLGVSVYDASGKMRDSQTVYWEVIDALGKIPDQTERDSLSMKIFGKSAQELNPLIEQGSAGIAKLTDEAKKMGAVMSDDALNALGKFDDTVQRLKSSSAAAKNAMGTILLPQLQSLATDGVDILGKFTSGLNAAGGDFGKISDVIGRAIGGIATAVLKNLPKIMEVATDIVMSLVNAIVDNIPVVVDTASTVVFSLLKGIIAALPKITDGAVKLVLSLVKGIIDNLPMLLEAAMKMIFTLVTGIASALPKLIPSIVSAMTLMVKTIIDNLPLILDAGLKLIIGLVQGLLAALPVLIDALPDIINAIVEFIISAIPTIIDAGMKLLISLVEALPTIIAAICEAIPKIINGILGALIDALPLLIDAGITLFIALVDALPDIITGIVDAIPKIIDAVVTMFTSTDMIEKIIQAGIDVFTALVSNMPKIISAVTAAVPKIIDALFSSFTHPNSTDKISGAGGKLGNSLMEGIFNGVNEKAQWLAEKLVNMFNGSVGWILDLFGVDISKSTEIKPWEPSPTTKGGTEKAPLMANGGNVLEPGTAIVGERGPELLNLPRGARVTPLDGRINSTQLIVININDAKVMRPSDADWLGELLVKNLKQKGVAIA